MGEIAGSSPVLTTLIKLVYEQSLRWDALVRTEVRWRMGRRRGEGDIVTL